MGKDKKSPNICQAKTEGGDVQHLEGFTDPGGIVPAWLLNMVIVETPLKVMEGIKKRSLDQAFSALIRKAQVPGNPFFEQLVFVPVLFR